MSLESKYGKILNAKAFVGVNKEDFKKQYRGKLPFDLDAAWDWIKANRGSKPKSKNAR